MICVRSTHQECLLIVACWRCTRYDDRRAAADALVANISMHVSMHGLKHHPYSFPSDVAVVLPYTLALLCMTTALL